MRHLDSTVASSSLISLSHPQIPITTPPGSSAHDGLDTQQYSSNTDDDLNLITAKRPVGRSQNLLLESVYCRVREAQERTTEEGSVSEGETAQVDQLFRSPSPVTISAVPPSAASPSPAPAEPSQIDTIISTIQDRQRIRVVEPVPERDRKRGKRRKGVSERSPGRDLKGLMLQRRRLRKPAPRVSR